nr:hypothetical protein [Tanacetum cinerariifolium]
ERSAPSPAKGSVTGVLRFSGPSESEQPRRGDPVTRNFHYYSTTIEPYLLRYRLDTELFTIQTFATWRLGISAGNAKPIPCSFISLLLLVGHCDRKECPVYYLSRVITGPGTGYSVVEGHCLTLVFVTQKRAARRFLTLAGYNMKCVTPNAMKSKALVDLLAHFPCGEYEYAPPAELSAAVLEEANKFQKTCLQWEMAAVRALFGNDENLVQCREGDNVSNESTYEVALTRRHSASSELQVKVDKKALLEQGIMSSIGARKLAASWGVVAKAVVAKAVVAPAALGIKLFESSEILDRRGSGLASCLPESCLADTPIRECSSPEDHSLLCTPRVLLT